MTTTEKNKLISAAILARVAAGMDIKEAIDAVLGVGTVAAVVDSVYEELRQ